MADNRVVVGVFADRAYAEQALADLRAQGFPDEHIGYVVRDESRAATEKLEEPEPEQETGLATGVVAGGVVGGVVGAAAALFIPGLGPALAGGILTATFGGAALGAAAGGLISALTHMGVPEEEARYYEREFNAGRTIVIVQADERPLEAFHILERNKAYNASTPPEVRAEYERRPGDPEATVKLDSTP